MLCTRCKITKPANAAAGKCTAQNCSKHTSSRHYRFCQNCSQQNGKCEGCGNMVVNSGATKPGHVKPL